MDLSLFDYPFPKDLVAQRPLPKREDSRMMVLRRATRSWEHKKFTDLATELHARDVLVLNVALADLVEVEGRLVPALPPYIKRKRPEDFTEEDFQRYKTVYGRIPGSKAAPTAGFHFGEATFEEIRRKAVEVRFVTLHISYDTYKPIRSPNVLEHPIHGESFEVPQGTSEAVTRAKKEGRRVIAVGTTTVRALESWANGMSGTTRLYITPDYRFRIVDAMLTNFHRPRSTVLVMVAAFAGRELVLSAYEEAIRERYRLFSYGDCMLIV